MREDVQQLAWLGLGLGFGIGLGLGLGLGLGSVQQLAGLAGARGLDVPLVLLAEVGLVVVRRVRGEVRVVARRGRRDDLGAARVPSGSSHGKYRQSSKKGGATYRVS